MTTIIDPMDGCSRKSLLGEEADEQTLDDASSMRRPLTCTPGFIVVYSGGCPLLHSVALDKKCLPLGRTSNLGLLAPDRRMSREHAELSFDGVAWTVRDLGSSNGTYVNGVRLEGEARFVDPKCIRVGQTILLPRADIVPYLSPLSHCHGFVIGPTLQRTLKAVDEYARLDEDILIRGESGSGKELAARTFHKVGPRGEGPLVTVNCAAIPSALAESLLFGAKRGAYTGASNDVQGYVRDANNGVLFLDEFGELGLDVQAKLLRVLETKEVLPLGTSRGIQVNVRFCFATHRDLQAAVTRNTFRTDLFYRIAQNEVTIPALRHRAEEIPWLIVQEITRWAANSMASAELVEACLSRSWPGNVRELLGEIRRAVVASRSAGATSVDLEHLSLRAGMALRVEKEASNVEASISAEEIHAALRRSATAAEAAKHLGVHRSHLYRLMKKNGIVRTPAEPA